MKKKVLGIASLMLLFAVVVRPQVTHGINWTWSAVTTNTSGQTITVTGYDFQCGTAAAGPFTQENAAIIPATTYLVPAASLTLGSTYFCEDRATLAASESAETTGNTGAWSSVSAGVAFLYPPAAATAPSGVVQ